MTERVVRIRNWRNTRIDTPNAWKEEKREPGALLERELERRHEKAEIRNIGPGNPENQRRAA